MLSALTNFLQSICGQTWLARFDASQIKRLYLITIENPLCTQSCPGEYLQILGPTSSADMNWSDHIETITRSTGRKI